MHFDFKLQRKANDGHRTKEGKESETFRRICSVVFLPKIFIPHKKKYVDKNRLWAIICSRKIRNMCVKVIESNI